MIISDLCVMIWNPFPKGKKRISPITAKDISLNSSAYKDLCEAARLLSKSTTISAQVLKDFGKAFTYSCFIDFAKQNKRVLIEDYTRQSIL